MNPVECPFEPDILSAAVQGRWPDRVDAELRAHVQTCRICSDVASVAVAIDSERDGLRSQIVVPDSGRVWWLAQLRARREAAQTAARPITAAQVIAFASAIALLGACFGATSTWFQSTLHQLAATVHDLNPQTVMPLLLDHGLLVTAMLAIVILLPALIYFAVAKE